MSNNQQQFPRKAHELAVVAMGSMGSFVSVVSLLSKGFELGTPAMTRLMKENDDEMAEIGKSLMKDFESTTIESTRALAIRMMEHWLEKLR